VPISRLSAFLGALISLAVVMATTDPAKASFAGRNGSIAFTGSGNGFEGTCANPTCIKIISPAGGPEQTLFTTSGAANVHYSPDGKLLVFDRTTRAGCCQIYTVRINGKHVRRITHGFDDECPAWSPDGKQIVFSRRPKSGRTPHLYIVNANGTHLHPLTSGAVGGSEPDWATNGLIAFQGLANGGSDIFVIRPDGTNETDLTNGSPGAFAAPSWSPDERSIAFIAGTNVWRMSADGTHRTHLTNTSSYKDRPVFSPDGKLIVYLSSATGLTKLWEMRANGTHASPIPLADGSDAGAPSWQAR